MQPPVDEEKLERQPGRPVASFLPGQLLFAFLCVVLLMLQFTLWLGKNGVNDWRKQQIAVTELEQENNALSARNDIVLADVRNLKRGLAGIEERARSELGMIGEDETFYQIIPPSPEKQPLSRFQFSTE